MLLGAERNGIIGESSPLLSRWRPGVTGDLLGIQLPLP